MKTETEIKAKLKECEDYFKNVGQFSEVKAEIYILKWVLGVESI